jgi:isopenicillin-N epimerase
VIAHVAVDRRNFLSAAGLAATSVAACGELSLRGFGDLSSGDAWDRVRAQFAIAPDLIDMSAMLLSSHPRDVRRAIERHSRELDLDTVGYLHRNNDRLTTDARQAAGRYLSVPARQIALVDSTTMGVGLVYAGLKLAPGDEILTTDQDYFVTHESIRLACARTGAVERRVSLHDGVASAMSADHIVDRIRAGITERTRVVGLTWVHSSTGLKLPVREIGRAIGAVNRGRNAEDRILFCLDGVHGYGNQAVTLDQLNCDFVASGCHKWLFGPRGTGIVAGREAAWRQLDTSIPSFIDNGVFDAWITGRQPSAGASGARLSPGGFKASIAGP